MNPIAQAPADPVVSAAAAIVIGLLVGSFLNVVIYRLPREMSLWGPRSLCPGCRRTLAPRDLVPVVSFVLSAGRCRQCGMRIRWQYPLVELAAAGLAWLVARHFGWSGVGLFYGWLAALLLAATVIDLEHQIIPNELVVAGLIGGALGLLLWQPLPWRDALYGFLAGGGLMLLIAVVSRGGMGGGDVKLVAMFGLYLGPAMTMVALLVAFFSGAAVSLVLLALRLKGRKDFIPFGPFLALGALAAAFYGPELVQGYLRLLR